MKLFQISLHHSGRGSYEGIHFVVAGNKEEAIKLASEAETVLNGEGRVTDATEYSLDTPGVIYSYDTYR